MVISTRERARRAGKTVKEYVAAAAKTGGKSVSLDTAATRREIKQRRSLRKSPEGQAKEVAEIIERQRAAGGTAATAAALPALQEGGTSQLPPEQLPPVDTQSTGVSLFGIQRQIEQSLTPEQLVQYQEIKANLPFMVMGFVNPLGKTGSLLKKGIFKSGKTIGLNPKTAKTAAELMAKLLKPKTLLAAGGAVAAAASAMFWGIWAQAEAPEPLGIVMRDVLREAQNTGNYELYDEAAVAREDILSLKLWEQITMWTPFSPIIGIPNKIKGAKAGAVIQDKLADDLKRQAATGESDDDKWARIRQEQAQQEKDNIDYYNSERKKMLQWEEEAADRDMKEDAEFWRKEREKQRELEAADREAIAAFWMEYRKEQYKFYQEQAPSNLKFGLL